MKVLQQVQVRTGRGLVTVDAFNIWQETVMGVTLALGLHVSTENPKKLMISELGTGFCTRAKIVLLKEKQPMLVADALRLPARVVRRQARTAFHHLLKTVGELDFIRGVANAQIAVAKQGEELNNIYAGVKHANSSTSDDPEQQRPEPEPAPQDGPSSSGSVG